MDNDHAVVVLMGTAMTANAAEINDAESSSLEETVANLENGYAEYYDIIRSEMTLCSSDEFAGNVENTYLLEMEAVLKAERVEEMDYYQGVENYCDTATDKISRMSAEDSKLCMDILSSEKEDIYKELEEYIGKTQSFVFYIKETYPIDNMEEKEILFENGMDYVSWEAMVPSNHEELRESGYARMEKVGAESTLMTDNMELQRAKASYSVDDAVNYMNKYTSNPSSCNVCGANKCTSKVDTTKYNSDYAYYVSPGSHVDCANFVSQALYAGGIATDDTWKAGSSSWIGVKALTDYMTSNKHWTSVGYSSVQKGDVVSFTSYSHVVMITSYDGTTYKYSGHTNDRKDATISIKSTTASSYKFYRVS
ncbi:MAG: amidase domain-containing protein [Lachnospiraceae bacterium]|nr:amidase domain-containing protein [Lachnospiraceae bacterium]